MNDASALAASGVLFCRLSAAERLRTEDRILDDARKEAAEAKDSLKKSQDRLTDLQAHRYQTFASGGKTWRLDSVKGSTCVLLASDQEWKNVETKKQSCTCEDFYRDEDLSLESRHPEVANAAGERAKRLGCE